MQKVKNLGKKRIQFYIDNKTDFYKGYKTTLSWFEGEVKEAIDEMKDNNSVYLEDELGDVFWTYMNLLHSLEQEGKITSAESVFERAYNKFSGRVGKNADSFGNWEDVKKIQKEKLAKEHNKLYNNDK